MVMVDLERIQRLVERVNSTSNAEFVKRLLDERRRTLRNTDGTVSTHELAYVTDDNGNAVVYPEVQSSMYGLMRYPSVNAYERAVERGDTLQMSAPDAELFTRNYKDYYPGFDSYACGGKKYPGGGKFFRTNLQNESPLMYQPMVDINYPIETPLRFRPQPDLGDYRAPESTGMMVDYPISLPERVPVSVQEPVSAPVVVEVPEQNLFSDEMVARRALKQRYAESAFNDKAKSKAGAQGAWQIMPITLKDYLGRGRGKAGDLNDPEYNRKVRDWVMGVIPRDLQEFWSESDSDRAKLAKLYAAYNWGAGNLRGFLRKKQKAGVDISNPDNWVDDLNPETRRYVKYLAFDEDILDSTVYTNAAFEKAAAERGYASGGKIHIKPENRGKFTALKKRTGHSASWFKAHGTPAQKKMAVFALNAKKWKHGNGGPLDKYGDDAVRWALSELKANKFRDGGEEKEKKSFWSLPVRVPNMTGTATAASTGLRDIPLMDSTVGREAAVLGTAIASPFAGHFLNVLGNPALAYTDYGAVLATLADAYGLASGANEIGKDINKAISGDYGAEDIPHTLINGFAFLPGSSQFTKADNLAQLASGWKSLTSYPRGVGNRFAEAVVRSGDLAENPGRLAEQLFDKRTLNYIFNPNADPNLAYSLPYRYSGESAGNFMTGAHRGDIVDQYFGKVKIPSANYDKGILPENLRNYVLKNYPDKNIGVVELGNAHAPFKYESGLNQPEMNQYEMQDLVEKLTNLGPVKTGVRSGGVHVPRKGQVLDPGGFDFTATKADNGYNIDAWDIWKFKPGEYQKGYLLSNLHPKTLIQRAGLKFIDKRGTPIIHHWTENVPDLSGR